MDFSLAGEYILSVLTTNHVKYLWGMVEHICIPSPRRKKQEDSEFEASLGFIDKFGLNERSRGMIRFTWLLVAKQKRPGVRRKKGWSAAGRTELEEGSGSGRMDISNYII